MSTAIQSTESSETPAALAGQLVWHAEPESLQMARDGLLEGLATLDAGLDAGQHPGAQVYISRQGQALLEYACGEASPGVPLTPDSLMAWLI